MKTEAVGSLQKSGMYLLQRAIMFTDTLGEIEILHATVKLRVLYSNKKEMYV